MSSSNVEGLIRAGIEAARSKKREEAYTLLLKATELDQQNETAWLWLAGVVDSPEDQQTCLENVLTINPYNEKAHRGLEALRARQKSPSAPPAPPPPAAPPAPSAPASSPFTSGVDDDDELPTSVSWEMPIPSSSPAQYTPVEEPTPSQYDDWVVGLNLRSSADDAPAAPEPLAPPTPMPFVASDNLFGFDDDELAAAAAADNMNPFAELRDYMTDGPFEADVDDEPDYPEPVPPPAAPPASLTPRPAAAPSVFAGDIDERDLLQDIEADDWGANALDSYDDDEPQELDAEEYFAFIPAEIKATRLPGTVERHHPLLVLALAALVALNIGAVVLVISTLTAG
jgi:hypothetical protein